MALYQLIQKQEGMSMKKAVATLSVLVTLFLGTSAALAGPIEPPDWKPVPVDITA
jgi:hypothetical protein